MSRKTSGVKLGKRYLGARVQQEAEDAWGVNVFSVDPAGAVVGVARYHYATKQQALDAKHEHKLGQAGRVIPPASYPRARFCAIAAAAKAANTHERASEER